MTTMNNEDPADPSVHEPRLNIQPPEPVAHMYPSDLERFKSSETFATAFSVAVGNPDERSVPLYAADQMREVIAAERERSHELLQAADHIRAGLEAKLAALSAALADKEQPK